MFPPRFIVADRIGNGLELSGKKRLLELLGVLLASAVPNLSPEGVFGRLCEREHLGSIGLGHGVALLHARMREGPSSSFGRGSPSTPSTRDRSIWPSHCCYPSRSPSCTCGYSRNWHPWDLRRATAAEQILTLLEGQAQDTRDK